MSRVEKEEHKNTRRNFVAPIIVSTRWGLSGSKLIKKQECNDKGTFGLPWGNRSTSQESTLRENPTSKPAHHGSSRRPTGIRDLGSCGGQRATGIICLDSKNEIVEDKPVAWWYQFTSNPRNQSNARLSRACEADDNLAQRNLIDQCSLKS